MLMQRDKRMLDLRPLLLQQSALGVTSGRTAWRNPDDGRYSMYRSVSDWLALAPLDAFTDAAITCHC